MKKFSSITRVNSRHTSRNKKVRRIIFIAILVILCLVALPSVLSFSASLALSPVHSLKSWIAYGAGSFPQYIRDRSSLLQEMDGLREQLAAQSGEKYTIQLLSEENKELRDLLGDTEEKRILSGVIGRPNKVPYDVLVIDKGTEDGIVEGAPVFVSKNTVIGSVKKSFPHASVVELVTSPGFTTSVYIFGPNIYTNAQGVGGGQLRVGVPQGITLTEGDLVVLPSASSGVYGKISIIDSIPTRPEQYGYVSPELPIASIRYVSVGSTPLQPVSFDEAQAIVNQTRTTLFMVPVPEGVLVTTGSSSATSTASSSTHTPAP